ncbi:hypothetical protein BDD12DRAFT_852261 [Trichophaea hybrida]|nr:hypothetical protein BDD12DRAFT_852261 [Trichophaea hybrida]
METRADTSEVPQSVATPPATCKWSFVIQMLNGPGLLYQTDILAHDTGEIIMSKTRDKYGTEVSCNSCISWLLHVTHIVSVIVETAMAELVCWNAVHIFPFSLTTFLCCPMLTANLKDDIELQQLPADTHLRNNNPNRTLTNAFRDPETLRNTPEFITRHYQLLVKRSSSDCISASLSTNETSVIVLKQVVNRWCIFWILFCSLCASPGIGIVAGLCSGRSDVGMNTSMAILTMIPAVVALVVWVTSELPISKLLRPVLYRRKSTSVSRRPYLDSAGR